MTKQPLYKVPVRSHLILDGCRWLVVGKDQGGYAVEGMDDGECTTLPYDRVDTAIKERNCEIISPVEQEKRKALLEFTGGFDRVEQLPNDERLNVRSRLALVLAVEKLEGEGVKLTHRYLSRRDVVAKLCQSAREIGGNDLVFQNVRGGRIKQGVFSTPKGRTLQKYLKLFRQYDRNPIVLMHREHLKGPQGEKRCKLSYVQERFIAYVLSHWVPKETKPQVMPLYMLAQTQWTQPVESIAANFTFPSITTIRNRIRAMSAAVIAIGRNGIRHSTNLKGAGSTDIRAFMFGERTETDQVYLSIFTDKCGNISVKARDPLLAQQKEELEENEIMRLWLHMTIDVASRMPLAWILSESADGDHSMALQRMATRDKTREKIRYECKSDPAPAVGLLIGVADNGTATRNGQVRAGQLGIGTLVIDGRTYHSADKPYIERPFGTMQWQVLNFLPGYAGSRPGELPGYDPKGNARLTPDDIYGTITRYLVDEYPLQPHRGTGMFGARPIEKMRECLDTYGPIDPPNQADRIMHLGIRREATVDSEGVRAFNIPYNSTQLQKFVDNRSSKLVTVHLDPDDLRKVKITAENCPDVMEADLSMTAFKDLTLCEALDIMVAAVEADPKKKQQYDEDLFQARKRRADESKFFSSPGLPESYLPIASLQKKADRLLSVEFLPNLQPISSMPPGSIMSRTGHPLIHKVAASSGPVPTKDVTSRAALPALQTFAPLKESKL